MVKHLLMSNRQRSVRRITEQGFTLVEMLVVITIIALIMGLVGPRVLNFLGEFEGQGCKNSDPKSGKRSRSLRPRRWAVPLELRGS